MKNMTRYAIYGVPTADVKGLDTQYRQIIFVDCSKMNDEKVINKIKYHKLITKVYLPNNNILTLIKLMKLISHEPMTKEEIILTYGSYDKRCNYLVGELSYGTFNNAAIDDILIINGCSNNKDALAKYMKLKGYTNHNMDEYICIRLGKNAHMNATGFKNAMKSNYDIVTLIKDISNLNM